MMKLTISFLPQSAIHFPVRMTRPLKAPAVGPGVFVPPLPCVRNRRSCWDPLPQQARKYLQCVVLEDKIS